MYFISVSPNLSSFGFSLIGQCFKKKPNVTKCAMGFALLLTLAAILGPSLCILTGKQCLTLSNPTLFLGIFEVLRKLF